MMSPPLGSTWLCRRQTSTFRATSVFPAPSYPGDEGAEVRAGDIMANADVGLAHSEKHSIGDGTANDCQELPRRKTALPKTHAQQAWQRTLPIRRGYLLESKAHESARI